jgi:hypothetical protein
MTNDFTAFLPTIYIYFAIQHYLKCDKVENKTFAL